MPELAVIDHEAVLAAVDPTEAIARVREGFVRHHRGEWSMPPKVYLPCPPHGDFRAMPARGDGLAMMKWICSFPDAPSAGQPTVAGVICLSDATTGRPLVLMDARGVTALRTGAAAAVASAALAPDTAGTVGVIGCGLHGAWAARCLAAAGYGPGTCCDPRPEAAAALATELGWSPGDRDDALACDVVCFVTPGREPVVDAGDLRPGAHLNMLGADGPGKAEATVDAVAGCQVFCHEWEQAVHGGEITAAVAAGRLDRGLVTELGAVLAGEAPGRRDAGTVTLFDSTGLAIQDLAVAAAVLEAHRAGRVAGQRVRL